VNFGFGFADFSTPSPQSFSLATFPAIMAKAATNDARIGTWFQSLLFLACLKAENMRALAGCLGLT
jgi:hypothetical protein